MKAAGAIEWRRRSLASTAEDRGYLVIGLSLAGFNLLSAEPVSSCLQFPATIARPAGMDGLDRFEALGRKPALGQRPRPMQGEFKFKGWQWGDRARMAEQTAIVSEAPIARP